MDITYDAVKCQRNIEARALSFDRALELDWSKALIAEDVRHDYGERRYRVMAPIDARLHVMIFTPRGNALHVKPAKSEQAKGKAL